MPNALGILWVVAAGIALLVPALIRGISLGPYDLLAESGLLHQPGVVIHNTWVGDQITQMIPWTMQAWTQVHHGQLPLWNPYSGLGMPLAFNWQSAPFGLPALIGYLFPVRDAYTVGVIVTVIVAGTGGYFLGRVLRLGVIGCAMVGTVFELSGPFVGWLGWPHAAVFSWAGWLFAAAVLIIRAERPVRPVALFAVVLALAIYAGQPEVLVVLAFALAVFLIIYLAQLGWQNGARSILRPVLSLATAAVVGGALAAPLALPGLQVFAGSVHSKTAGQAALPLENLIHLVAQGFDGLPIAGSRMFGSDGPFYVGAFVGVTAIVLAVVAAGASRRRPAIVAFAAVGIVSCGVVFVPFLISILDALPLAGSVGWTRALLPMAFAIAVLAGCGVDALVRIDRDRIWKWTGVGFAAAGAVVLVFLFGTRDNLPANDRSIRAHSFIGPAIEVLFGLVVVGLVLLDRRRRLARAGDSERSGSAEVTIRSLARSAAEAPHVDRPPEANLATDGRRRFGSARLAGLGLLACETVLLVAAGAPLWSSSPTSFNQTPAVAAIRHDVGTSVVGLGSNPSYFCSGLGIQPNANIAFNVHQLTVYDPMVPKGYFTSFAALTGRSAGEEVNNQYCPALTQLSQARLYGVAFILESAGTSAPMGSTFVARA